MLLIDAAIVLSALGAICWALVVGPLFTALETDPAAQAVTLAYPIGGLAVLFCAITLVLRQARATLASGLLVLGLATLAIADSAYLVLVADDTYRTGNPIDLMWVGW